MDKYQDDFVKDYKQTLDNEFKLFMAEANKHSYQKEQVQKPYVIEELNQDARIAKNEFNQQKEILSGYKLSPAQAKGILEQGEKDIYALDTNSINGADTYRFMNSELKKDPAIALTAYKQDNGVAKHFPIEIKNEIGQREPEKALPSMVYAKELTSKLTQSGSRKQTQSYAMA